MSRVSIFSILLVAACAQFPALDDTLSDAERAAPFPDFVPTAPLLAQAQSTAIPNDVIDADLSARIARLTAQAARLRGPVLTATDRARLSARF